MKKYTLALLPVVAMLTACNNEPASQNTTTAQNVIADDADIALADVQEISINNGTEPESLDQHKTNGVPESNIIRQMMVGLITTDGNGKAIAGVAKDWQSSEDGKTWTFNLRDSNWSNGDPVTAHDFVYSFRRAINPETAAPRGNWLVDIKIDNAQDILDGKADVASLGVSALDDKTLQLTLTDPVPYLIDTLAHSVLKPVHQKTVENFGDKWTDPTNIVVNGAYKPSVWLVNERIEMLRNPSYYDNDKTVIDKINFLAISDSSAAINRYMAGDLDISGGVSETDFKRLQASHPNELKISPLLCTYYYETNKDKPPFNDVNVRRALSLTLDREIITDKVLGMGQTAAYQMTPTAMNGAPSYTPEYKSWDKDERNRTAIELLTKAGYSKQNPLNFEILYNTSESHKTIASAATSLWNEALDGMIKVSMVNQEWKTYLDSKREGKYQMARAGWCAVYNEPSAILNTLRTGASSNTGKYASSEYDNILNQTLGATVSDSDRTALYAKAEAVLDKDAPNILVYHYINSNMVKPYVIGYSTTDPLDNFQVKDMKIAAH